MNNNFLVIGLSTILAACASAPPQPPATAEQVSATASFCSPCYLIDNPDAAADIKAGKYRTALDHYEKQGRWGKNAKGDNYETTFTGTGGNDVVQGLGPSAHSHFIGVALAVDPSAEGDYPVRFISDGTGEIDQLVGNPEGGNAFILGSYLTSATPKAVQFYVGKGDQDYALVKNFHKGKDTLYLTGKNKEFKLAVVNGDTRITTSDGDLVGIVEGVADLNFDKFYPDYGQSSFK